MLHSSTLPAPPPAPHSTKHCRHTYTLVGVDGALPQGWVELCHRDGWSFATGVGGTLPKGWVELCHRGGWNFAIGVGGALPKRWVELCQVGVTHTFVHVTEPNGRRGRRGIVHTTSLLSTPHCKNHTRTCDSL